LPAVAGQSELPEEAPWTGLAPPKKALSSSGKEFNKFDQANFATTIGAMSEYFSISGGRSNKKVRLTRAGWERAKALVQELVG